MHRLIKAIFEAIAGAIGGSSVCEFADDKGGMLGIKEGQIDGATVGCIGLYGFIFYQEYHGLIVDTKNGEQATLSTVIKHGLI